MAVVAKLDLKKQYKELFAASVSRVSLITVPKLNYLMIDGSGDPNGTEFQEAVQALYSLSYTIKFWSKSHQIPLGWQEFGVAPLEGLWWVAGNDQATMNMNVDRKLWRWTAMIMQPSFVDLDLVEIVRSEVAVKKPNSALSRVRFEAFEEGLSVQLMHIGPYSEELPNILKIADYMESNNLVSNGLHHEVYLGDPRRTAPEKLRTILRHPVKKAE